MSRWEEQFSGHSIHNVLTEIKNTVSGKFDGNEENEFAERKRIVKAVGVY